MHGDVIGKVKKFKSDKYKLAKSLKILFPKGNDLPTIVDFKEGLLSLLNMDNLQVQLVIPTSNQLNTFIFYLQLPVQSVPITTKVVSSNPVHGEVYSKRHYVIKLVSDLRQVGDFL